MTGAVSSQLPAEAGGELRPGGDVEFGVDVAEVHFHGLERQRGDALALPPGAPR